MCEVTAKEEMVGTLPVSSNIAIMCIAACVVLYSWYLYSEQRRLDAKLTAIAGQLLSAQRATQAHVDALSRQIGGPPTSIVAAAAAASSAIPMLFATVGEGGGGICHHYCSVEEEDDDEDEDEEDDEDVCLFEEADEEDEEDEAAAEIEESKEEKASEDKVEDTAEDKAEDKAEEDTEAGEQQGTAVGDLSSKKVDELRAMLRDRGGDTRGTKTVLQERLVEILRASGKIGTEDQRSTSRDDRPTA